MYSHQQAIAQSETFLKQMQLPCTAMANTAMAAKYVAESGDPSRAAIASRETAALYGLEVLVPDINADGDNTTRFIVISKERPAQRQPVLFAVHGGQQARQAGRGDPEDRRFRLQYGVDQEPAHAPCAL